MERLKIFLTIVLLQGCTATNEITYSPKNQIIMTKVVQLNKGLTPDAKQELQKQQDQQIQMYINSHVDALSLISSIDEHAYIIHLLNKKLWDLNAKAIPKKAKGKAKESDQNTFSIPEVESDSKN